MPLSRDIHFLKVEEGIKVDDFRSFSGRDSRRVFDALFKDFYGFLVILGYPWGPIRRPKATLGGGNERTGFDSLPGGSPGAHFEHLWALGQERLKLSLQKPILSRASSRSSF